MTPVCPNCRVPLVRRVNRTTGKPFHGCPNWPKCDYTEGPQDCRILTPEDLKCQPL